MRELYERETFRNTVSTIVTAYVAGQNAHVTLREVLDRIFTLPETERLVVLRLVTNRYRALAIFNDEISLWYLRIRMGILGRMREENEKGIPSVQNPL